MATIRSYRLFSLALLLAGVLTLFLGFFFIWVIGPVLVVGAFYIVFVILEERRQLRNGASTRRTLRRKRLSDEAHARELDKQVSL